MGNNRKDKMDAEKERHSLSGILLIAAGLTGLVAIVLLIYYVIMQI